jgi:class 3 adenylate cyclase
MTPYQTSNAKHLFLDVVSFTRDRSVEAQTDIIRNLNTIVNDSIKSLSIPKEKLMLLPTGDGICITLLELTEPFDIHLLLAITIIERVYMYNQSERDIQRQFEIRIGINENVDNIVQDINKKKNVAGLGINMAQRIMNCSDGNQILVGQTVYETLRSREKYMNSFRQYSATGKHDIRFNVFQYIETGKISLNNTIPSQFDRKSHNKEEKLSIYQAYYFAYVWKNYDYLYSIKDEPGKKYTIILLVHYLALDAINKKEAGKYGTPYTITWKSGEVTFEEQYNHYDDIDFQIRSDLAEKFYEKSELSSISGYFEKDEYGLPTYAFLNESGKYIMEKIVECRSNNKL